VLQSVNQEYRLGLWRVFYTINTVPNNMNTKPHISRWDYTTERNQSGYTSKRNIFVKEKC